MTRQGWDDTERAIADIAAGRPVVLVDELAGTSTGDVLFAAERASPRTMAFTVRHTSGLVCAAMPGEMLDRLDLPLMASTGGQAAFTVSFDAAAGVTTGISATDRARTVRLLADPSTVATDLHRPGHVLALRVSPGGVLDRRDRAEAALDLVRMAGLVPVGVMAELVNEDGTEKHGRQLCEFANEHDLSMVSIDALVEYRKRREILIDRVAETRMPTRHGVFTAFGYRRAFGEAEAVALVKGAVAGCRSVRTYFHFECPIGDVFGTFGCKCAAQLNADLAGLGAATAGVMIYIRSSTGSGIGRTCPTLAVSTYDEVGQILRDLGVQSLEVDGSDAALAAHLSATGFEVSASEISADFV